MIVTNVLYMSVKTPVPSNIDLIRDIIGVVDEKSVSVLDQLMHSEAFEKTPQSIQTIEVLEIKKDISLPQIPRVIEREGFTTLSLGSCLYFLSALKGKKNTDLRRAFFEDGRILISTDPIMINGELNFMVIGQDQCQKKHDQRPFSIRLLAPSKTFLHALYKVLVAKV